MTTYAPYVIQHHETGMQTLFLTPEHAPSVPASGKWSLLRRFSGNYAQILAHNERVAAISAQRERNF